MTFIGKRAAIYEKPLVLFALLTFSSASVALAQAPAPAPVAAPAAAPRDAEAAKSALGDRRMSMTEKVTAADFKQIDGGPLLLAAYAVVWAVFFIVLVYTLARVRRVGDEVKRLEAQLHASKSDGP